MVVPKHLKHILADFSLTGSVMKITYWWIAYYRNNSLSAQTLPCPLRAMKHPFPPLPFLRKELEMNSVRLIVCTVHVLGRHTYSSVLAIT